MTMWPFPMSRNVQPFYWPPPRQVEGMEACRAHGLTPISYNSFYTNLQSLYYQQNCIVYHIWNLDETCI